MSMIGKGVTGMAAALVLCSSSSFAAVTSAAPAQVSPYAVVGMYGSPASAQVAAASVAATNVAVQDDYRASNSGMYIVLGIVAATIALAVYILASDEDGGDLDLGPPPAPVSPA